MCFDKEPDLKNRDPLGVNSHIKVHFSDVLGEPDATHSLDCCWLGSECCYTFMNTICYGLCVGLFHLCLSCGWGIHFGLESFCHIWVIAPFVRCWTLVMHVPARCLSILVHCVLDPWCEASSYIFMMFAGGLHGVDRRPANGKAFDSLEKGVMEDSGMWTSPNKR